MGLFRASTPLLADLNLLFQIAISLVLVSGLYLRSKHRYVKHGAIMGSSLVLHTISIVGVMVPSLLSMMGIFENPWSYFALITIAHGVIGSLVEVFGIWLVGEWVFHTRKINVCFKRKRMMRAVIYLWSLELIIGLLTYSVLYIM